MTGSVWWLVAGATWLVFWSGVIGECFRRVDCISGDRDARAWRGVSVLMGAGD